MKNLDKSPRQILNDARSRPKQLKSESLEARSNLLELAKKVSRERLGIIKSVALMDGINQLAISKEIREFIWRLSRDFATESSNYKKIKSEVESFFNKPLESLDFSQNCLDQLTCQAILQDEINGLIGREFINLKNKNYYESN